MFVKIQTKFGRLMVLILPRLRSVFPARSRVASWPINTPKKHLRLVGEKADVQ